MKAFKQYTTGFKVGILLGRLATITNSAEEMFNLGVSHGRIVRKALEDIARSVHASVIPFLDS